MKAGLKMWLEGRIRSINEILKYKAHSTTMRDLKIERRALQSVLEWIK